MGFRLENIGMLFGLFALAVPVILHLLRRSRYDTLDWGAMQFLPDSIVAQRKRWLDDFLLMLLRMAMIALIVLALATPISTSPWLAPLGDRSAREVVVVLDGTYSMGVRVPGQPTPWAEAIREARVYRDQAVSSDRLTFLIAREPPLLWPGDFEELAAQTPNGNANMPRALAEAWKHLQRSKAATKEIIVLTDQQQHGWSDLATLTALENLGNQWRADSTQAKEGGLAIPSLRVVKVGAELPKALPNFSLAPLTASRGVAKLGQKITFQSALHLDGFAKYVPPRSVKFLIDGKEIATLPLPANAEVKQGQIPLSYAHKFDKEGPCVVSLVVEADDANDVLTADNAQHVVVEVVKQLPILLIDGDKKLSSESSSFFLQRALSAKNAVPYSAWKPATIDADKPAVIVLADVPRLDSAQIDRIDRFLAEGGGLLIMAGERAAREKAFYNAQAWLPAKLGEVASSKEGVQPEPRTFQHPALELFRTAPAGSTNQIRFTSWWKVALGRTNSATANAMLSNGDPLLLEKPYKQGRVILCTVPPDRRWGSTFPNAWEYPVLIHELAYYLAGSRNVGNLRRDGVGEASMRALNEDNRGGVGVHQVTEPSGRVRSIVVSPDLRESNLTRCTDDTWRKVRDRLPVAWQTDQESTVASPTKEGRREELWWLLMVGVIGLLCTEVWMTRRMALARGR